MPERIDVHNHFLPRLDDGCSTISESFTCIGAMRNAGYRRFFLTPHTGPTDMCSIRPEESIEHFHAFTAAARQAAIDAEFKIGGEVRLSQELLSRRDLSLAVTYGITSRYCLVDLWEPDWPRWADETVDWLISHGRIVVLAHPERMPIMQNYPALMDRLAERGVLFQGNLGPLGGSEMPAITQLAESFLRQGRYFMLGSDCHRPSHLAARMAGLDRAIELVGGEKVDELTCHNPALIWNSC